MAEHDPVGRHALREQQIDEGERSSSVSVASTRPQYDDVVVVGRVGVLDGAFRPDRLAVQGDRRPTS
ncbi:hypothetical protein [Streptomyces bluensis]|uniref:hypothetical protein n=1 Tax=Streptomyces bluensis TaxID=33897 RepID=UPI0019C3BDE6|nr:hypothetical protein [Streptomyces bluensis]GGZ83198.1 hypothetical protein GCM10010344_58020 [Streptomyces bluensis]